MVKKLRPVYIIWATEEGKTRTVCAPNRRGYIYYSLRDAKEYAIRYRDEHPTSRVELKYYNLEPTGTFAFYH